MTFTQNVNRFTPSPVTGPAPGTVGSVTPTSSGFPTIQQAGAALFGAPATSSSSSGSFLGDAANSVFGWIFSSRFVAIILGLICIAGAVFLFKPAVSISTVKGAITG